MKMLHVMRWYVLFLDSGLHSMGLYSLKFMVADFGYDWNDHGLSMITLLYYLVRVFQYIKIGIGTLSLRTNRSAFL